MQEQLETCCGSPAYAAPELITGDNYMGSKVDIWSMGVLLYALLCGFLPFDDENVTKLYKKIKRGRYFCPPWLSVESREILSAMLQVDPSLRISIEQLKSHSWITKGTDFPTIECKLTGLDNEYDSECLVELAIYHRTSVRYIESTLRQNKFDYLTASYLLLQSKKSVNKKYSLVQQKMVLRETKQFNNSNHLSPVFDTSPLTKRVSMDSLKNSELLLLASPNKKTPQKQQVLGVSPVNKPSRHSENKENFVLPHVPLTRKSKKSGAKLCVSDYVAPVSPKFAGFSASLDTAVNRVGDDSLGASSLLAAEKRAKSFESPTFATVTPKRKPPRQLGSSAKKVFGSIEKGLDCVKNLLTPKKSIFSSSGPRQVTNLCNVSAMNDKMTAEEALKSLQQALQRKGIFCKQKGYTLRGKVSDGRRVRLRFELEVCELPQHRSAVGVRRKRLEGDAWLYKKVCEEVLRLALLDSSSVAATDV